MYKLCVNNPIIYFYKLNLRKILVFYKLNLRKILVFI